MVIFIDAVAPIMPPKPEAVTSSNGTATSMKQIASVLYPYTAENEGDLTVLEGDEVEIVETNSENPGWIKVSLANPGQGY